MVCGTAEAIDTSIAFETVMRIYFVKHGKIEFLYKKDSTQEEDGWTSGIFEFFVNDEVVFSDSDLNDDPNEWKLFVYDFYPGM